MPLLDSTATEPRPTTTSRTAGACPVAENAQGSHSSGDRPRLLIVVTEDWYFWTHRLALARAAQDAGYDVRVVTRDGAYRERIEQQNVAVIPLTIPRRLSPRADLAAVWRLASIYRRYRPDVVHHVSAKTVLLGSLAARLTGVPAVVNAFTGLGDLAESGEMERPDRFRQRAARWALRRAMPNVATRVIVQNEQDAGDLVATGIVRNSTRIVTIRGAGVDAGRFATSPQPTGPVTVLLAARMLWAKGVATYVAAARRLLAAGHNIRLTIAGRIDSQHPDHVPHRRLRQWHDAGWIRWLGCRDDMPSLIAQSHIVCLPTRYGEGIPKVLLEGAASGRPLVASDWRGCRDVCRDGETGLLVAVDDPRQLSDALTRLAADRPLRERLGQAGRRLVEQQFTQEEIARQTLNVYADLLGRISRRRDDWSRPS